MRVHDAMTPGVELIGGDQTLVEAAAVMRDRNVGALPVREDGSMIGMISDRDIVVRALARGVNPGATSVRQAMTAELVCCRFDDDIESAAELMRKKKVRRLLVVDQENQPAGMISLGDMAKHAHARQLAGAVLEEVCSSDCGSPQE